MEIEHFFICPYCWQKISMLLDLSAGAQNYVEDCEVCCRPIKISFTIGEEEVSEFEAETIEE
ncbi:MAG: CPXCG motif-containing cysteine-rich protein [Acidobacteria bacterium]|nr:MAG: CPXCG motif-containing cysteine-rich protein [Acidobacteriota bacterium]REK02899.1 MAG: CPXCG motif-containing cysteine-rich protein [Acidobacteriota bacterium]REK13297.1 MAG: CPXCG motif-containing cysteine-rich protein [Acidobacteriota bacterium]REK41291.1 MAG: CPXCG motif-containing cysteine-rich protein [Acidobacteriota bacterium]